MFRSKSVRILTLGLRHHRSLASGIRTIEITPPNDATKWTRLIDAVTKYRQPHMNVSIVHQNPYNTQAFSLELAKHMPSEYVIPHIGVSSYNPHDIEILLNKYKNAFKRVFIIRGDKNQYADNKSALVCNSLVARTTSLSSQSTVLDVVRFARNMGFIVGAACHPEGHTEAPSVSSQIENALKKQEAGCSYLVTQSIFHLPPFIHFERAAKASGLKIPIEVNIFPIKSSMFLQRFIDQNKITIPNDLINFSDKEKQNYYSNLIGDLIRLNHSIVFSSLNNFELLKTLEPCSKKDYDGSSLSL